MIVNIYEEAQTLRQLPGTNILENTYGVVGTAFRDPMNMLREWTIQSLYMPVHGRSIGGIRAKVVDQKGFVSFCNQRDLEVMLDMVSPGAYCMWLGQDYVDVGDNDWYGLCVDADDLLDDLYDRELELRARLPSGAVIPEGTSIERRVHDGSGNDYIESLLLLWDFDPELGIGPDPRFETIERRWQSIERTPQRLRGTLWSRT